VIKTLTQFLLRFYDTHVTSSPDNPVVLIMSYTGTASFNVDGKQYIACWALIPRRGRIKTYQLQNFRQCVQSIATFNLLL
jgi:hypothetical protein